MEELNCNLVIWNVTVPYPGGFLDKNLSKEDYRKLMSFPSNEAYETLENKYRFCKYKISLKDLVDKLYNMFAHPRYIHFKLNIDYLRRWVLLINFIFMPEYIITILKSKRKSQYIKNAVLQFWRHLLISTRKPQNI